MITYAAPIGFLGIDSVTYKVTDPGGLMDTALLIIVITDPNNIPQLPTLILPRLYLVYPFILMCKQMI